MDFESKKTENFEIKDETRPPFPRSHLEDRLSEISSAKKIHSEVLKLRKELKKKNEIIREYGMIVENKKAIIQECKQELKR